MQKISDLLPPHPLYGRQSYIDFHSPYSLSREEQGIIVKFVQKVLMHFLERGEFVPGNQVAASIIFQYMSNEYVSPRQVMALLNFAKRAMSYSPEVLKIVVDFLSKAEQSLPEYWVSYLYELFVEEN